LTLMGFVRDKIGPALYDFGCRRIEPEFGPQRAAVLVDARGHALEIGAGTGLNLQHYPPEVEEIVATEPEAGMMHRAKDKAAELGRSVRFVEASAERLPFEAGEFDTVVCTLVLCSVDDQARALAEIRRVLKPGGRFLFIEHIRSDDPKLARWQDRLDRPWSGTIGMGCHPNRRTLESIESAGFEVDALERGTLPKSPPIVRPTIAGRAARR
jgi:ubiquinone/menaquinone biosynthesis C-methylase UbiE